MKTKRWISLSEWSTTLIDIFKDAMENDTEVKDLKLMIIDDDEYNMRITDIRYDRDRGVVLVETNGYIEYYRDQIDKPSDL